MFRRTFRITAWILSIVLLLVLWASEAGQLPGSYNKEPRPNILLFLGFTTLFLTLIGAVIALLIALIPRKGTPYWERFVLRLPYGLLPITLLATMGSIMPAVTMYSGGYAMATRDELERRSTPPQRDCMSVREGSFEVAQVVIERHGNEQIQTHKTTGEVERFQVEWLTPCTYRLITADSAKGSVDVHITSVTRTGDYECLVEFSSGNIGRVVVHRR